ncbi:MAG TPA: NYN domain-containing protein [Ktedonobacteraceae bacterium]
MDGTSSLFRRLRSTIFYLGAGFLLAESTRVLLAWLQSLSGPRKRGTEPAKNADHASVAFLIDGENISSPQVERVVEFALNEAKKLGEVTVRRVYGNCSLFNQANNIWNDTSLRLELEQIHLARPTINKNTADIALAINAIELAKDDTCNRFCIVTSDSDFTPLVRRLRELKCRVLGVGDKRTPATLMKACNWFVYTDRLTETSPAAPRTPPRSSRSQTSTTPANEASGESQPAPSASEQQPGPQQPENSSQPVIQVLTGAYLDAARVRGVCILLSRLGLSLKRLHPDFKAIAYAEDLSALIQQYPDVFDFEKRPNGHPQMRLKG